MTDRPPSRDSSDESELRPVKKTGPPGVAFGDTERQSAELAAMRRMLSASRDTFSLSIAVCNSPALRDYLVKKLLEDDADYVSVGVPRDTENFLDYALADLGSRTASALFLVDLENSLPSEGPRPAIRLLNATREKWQQSFACPVVLWLPEYAVKLLAVEAKDFWSWRSHQFEFVAESGEQTPAPSEAFAGGLDDAINLDVDRKQFRIAELRERIEAAGNEPGPDMTTHTTTWLTELGILLRVVGDLDEAETMFRKALEINEKLGRLDGMAVEYSNLGDIYRTRGDLDEAEKMHRKALEIEEKLGRLEGVGRQSGNLGVIFQIRGDLGAAEKMHRKALEISEKLGQFEDMAVQYGNLGLIFQTHGDLDAAEKMHRKSLEIEKKLGRLEGMAADYGNLGLIFRRRGDLDGAERMHRKALEIAKKLGGQKGIATSCGNLGLIYSTRGDLDEAEMMHRKALKVDEKLGHLEGVARHYANLGGIYSKRGTLDEAEKMLRKALKINEKLGQLEGMAQQYGNLGFICQARGDLDEARKFWTKARDLFVRIGIPHDVEKTQALIDGLPE